MDDYVYTALPNDRSIRLLTLFPSLDAGAPIQCSLQTVATSSSDRPYAALSYSWGTNDDGDASLSESIVVDGQRLGVTRNLLDGLRRIRRRDGNEVLWVDAVCVDQTNKAERSAQVAKMAAIYSCAAQVLVWLGEGPGDAENAALAAVLGCLRQRRHSHYGEHCFRNREGRLVRICLPLAAITAAAVCLDPVSAVKQPYGNQPRELPMAILDLFDCEELGFAAQEVNGLLWSFAKLRYWSRRWIIQELFHAQHQRTCIRWGKEHILLCELQDALSHLPDSFNWRDVQGVLKSELSVAQSNDIFYAACRIKKVMGLRTEVGKHPNGRLIHVLESSNGHSCSDPRDRLFALLSMDPLSKTKPDYRSSPAAVYASFCSDVVEQGYSCSLLNSSAHQRAETSQQDDLFKSLPSWCFDLRQDFPALKRVAVFGPASTSGNGILTCSALWLGSIGHDESGRLMVVSATTADDNAVESYSIKYVRTMVPRGGDMVCILQDFGGHAWPHGLSANAILLRSIQDDSNILRIVGDCLVRLPDWPTKAGQIVRKLTIR